MNTKHQSTAAILCRLATCLAFLFSIHSAFSQQWTNILGGSTSSHRGMHVSPNLTRYTVGDNGQFFKHDANDNPIFTNSPASSNLKAVHSLGNAGDTVYVVGDNGLIRKSTNGGASWTNQDVSVSFGLITLYPTLYDVHFINVNKGVAVGQFGYAFTTQDGGATWTFRSTGTTETLRAVVQKDQPDALWIFAYGDAGTHVYSEKGGQEWFVPLAAGDFGSVDLTAADIRGDTICVTGGNAVYRATNFNAYIPSYPPSAGTLLDVSMADSNNMVAAGTSGKIFTSENGGASWVPYSTGRSEAITCVAMPHPVHAWASAERSYSGTWRFANTPEFSLSYASSPVYPSSTQDFGTVQENFSTNRVYTITNSGSGTLSSIGISTGSGSFAVSGLGLQTLPPGSSTTFTLHFSPTSPGLKYGNLSITHNANGSPFSALLQGTGSATPVPVMNVNVSGIVKPNGSLLDFGLRELGTTTGVEVTILNLGTGPLTGLSVNPIGVPDFSTNQPSSTVNPGQSTTFSVFFSAQSPSVRLSRTMTINSNVGTHEIILRGAATGSTRAGRIAAINRKIRKINKKVRTARRKKQASKVRRYKSQIKRLKRQRRSV